VTGERLPPPPVLDELGAHVSAAGGVAKAPGRARDRDSVCLQLFTKQPSRWAEPHLDDEQVRAFRDERTGRGILVAGAHDSYLINLSSPDPALRARSYASFREELVRCQTLELDFLVTHPGNATDGDIRSGLDRNAEALGRALEEVPGSTRVLLELTAGAGSSVGGTFENLARIVAAVPLRLQGRTGICFDTCHAYAAGYDLVRDYEGVWREFDAVIGLDRLELFHLNDGKGGLGSRLDRHEHIGRGSLGEEPFRRLMNDDRMARIPKLLETPKEDDPVALDRENLRVLRSFRGRA
jgi:deoxyribonuclease-4